MAEPIKANTCPYCGAPYTLAYGGCRDRCEAMRRHHQLNADAALEAERTYDDRTARHDH